MSRLRRRSKGELRGGSSSSSYGAYDDLKSRVSRGVSRVSAPAIARRAIKKVIKSVRRAAKSPVRNRLRTLSVSAAYVNVTPHATRKEVVSCVKNHLRGYRGRIGSGVGNSRRVSRAESRRRLFQAARRSC